MNNYNPKKIIESLRSGVPPQVGVTKYAVGHEKLLDGIKKFHLSGIADNGIIRFVSGSWGSGKTHFFRLLRDISFDSKCLVSGVELSQNEAPLNKFERVFFTIIRNIVTPSSYFDLSNSDAAPIGRVFEEALTYLSLGEHSVENADVSFDQIHTAKAKLMECPAIDIDFKKIVSLYWDTYLPEQSELGLVAQKRAELLQWFAGEGNVPYWRKNYEIHKIISKENAKIMLLSLSAFIKLVGYNGLVILFDEAETSFSEMRKNQLRDAHNNLLHLINNINEVSGLFLIYATTPDFYNDPKQGIVVYAALSGRIGTPKDHPPKALDTVWNIDAIEFTLEQYQAAALNIRDLYIDAHPDSVDNLPKDDDLKSYVDRWYSDHPHLSHVSFWRVLVTATVSCLDSLLEGEEIQPGAIYVDIMDSLRDS